MNSAPCAAQRSAAHAAAARSAVVVRGLVAELDEVGPAAQRAVERALEPAAVGDEVQVRVLQARAALGSAVHTHSLASATGPDRRYHRSSEREPITG